MLIPILLVMLGGAMGSAARYLVTHFFSGLLNHHGFPLGTLLVNVTGSLIVGYVLASPVASIPSMDDRWRLLAATGFCGGFTTFSTFSFETMAYVQSGRFLLMALNVGLNNILSLCAVVIGMRFHGR